MLPMVTTVAEVRAARDIYDRVARRLRRRGERIPERLPPLGIMIETPGAALSADALALEADFFAIGTNDLTAYTLAVDRAETEVAELYDPLHPAVLRLVQFSTEAALRMRMPVSVCGEMAANPRLTPLLLGLGLRSFSMNAGAVPRVKQVVRAVDIDDCVRLARRVMEQVGFGEDCRAGGGVCGEVAWVRAGRRRASPRRRGGTENKAAHANARRRLSRRAKRLSAFHPISSYVPAPWQCCHAFSVWPLDLE